MFRSLLALVIAAAIDLAAADVRGRWTGAMEINGGRIGIVVTLSQRGQELSGAVATSYPIAGGLGKSPPLLLRKVEPEYTDEARAARVQGTVVLRVEIDPSGKVATTHIAVIRSLGLGLDEKAIEAVKQWKFKPATNNGTPVTAKATIEVSFRL